MSKLLKLLSTLLLLWNVFAMFQAIMSMIREPSNRSSQRKRHMKTMHIGQDGQKQKVKRGVTLH